MSMLSEEKSPASYDFPAVLLGVSEVGYANASTLTGVPKHAGFGAALVVFFFSVHGWFTHAILEPSQ